MASRVQGFGRAPPVAAYVEEEEDVEMKGREVPVEHVASKHRPAYVDKAVLDEAVEATLGSADAMHADSMRKLWAMDQDSVAAQAYFRDQVRMMSQSRFAEMGRKPMNINEVLTQAEATKVTQYAPEFAFNFRNTVNNEHGFFSSRRAVDHQLIASKYPAGMKVLDFGGSVLHHVRQGDSNVTVMSPFDVDAKDPTRATLTRLALRKLSADMTVGEATRAMAHSVLQEEGKYHVSQSVQQANVQAKMSMAVHVYDVPLIEWPRMMERCGVRVHEGCLHFVNDFFSANSGEFEFSGAWYEIDRFSDTFRMRVGRGSTQWYTHKWSEYMKYGANQILRTDKATYSYQIIERRADTIFYRVLRIDDRAEQTTDQVFALPTVPMVEVHGFEVFPDNKPGGYGSRRDMLSRTYTFPQALWERMIAHASIEVDRGGLSYEKMFNFYRTVVPRQSINGVHVSGGQKVGMYDVPALVVLSSVVAYANVLLMQRTTEALTDEVREDRKRRDESTAMKAFQAFVDTLVGLGRIPFSPFSATGSTMSSIYLAMMRDKIVTWKPQVRIRPMSTSLMTMQNRLPYSVFKLDDLGMASQVMSDPVAKITDLANVDSEVARELLSRCGDFMNSRVKTRLESTAQSTTAVPSTDGVHNSSELSGEKPGVTHFMKGDKKIRRTVFPAEKQEVAVAWRKSAVQEALEECIQESKAMLYTCERISRDVLVNGRPNVDIMRRRCEELYNPDVWYVRNGVLASSALNPGSVQFTHGGVYMIEHPVVAERLQPVMERWYKGEASDTGKYVEREHMVLPVSYTGYVLVIDGLKIFNGPAISDSLARVLEMGDSCFDFKIVRHEGPPGCGKTTTVATDGDPKQGCVFLTPTRVAREGLSKKLMQVHKVDKGRVRSVCRTLHSLLVNYARLPNEAKQGFDRLLADEYVLARAGQWIAAAVLLGVKEVHAYGDYRQISHKPRVTVSTLFLNLQSQVLEEEFLGYRNAAEICACFAFVYNNEIRTTVKEAGVVKRVKTLKEVVWRSSCRLLSVLQADKLMLQEVADAVGGPNKPVVNTVHEAQGSDCDQVVIFNGETRRRGPEDEFYLYGKVEYCLVAASRARLEVVYVKASDEPDVMTDMIARALDPRRVEACREIATQGENNLSF